MNVVDGEVINELSGKTFYLAHGDALGSLKRGFKFIRAVFRNHFCQRLYSIIPPNWTIPFAHAWSSHSRENGFKYVVKNAENTLNRATLSGCPAFLFGVVNATAPCIIHF